MKKFLAELMNRSPHFITQSIDWYDGSGLISRENCIWSPCFLSITAWFSLDISVETASWITLVCSLVCWDYLFVDGSYIATSIIIIEQQNLGIATFSDDTCSSTTVFILIRMEYQSISYSEYLLFSFSPDAFTYQLDFFILTLESSAIC